ncbi:GntR family transcriptional regulator [Leucobacter allii]|uniref:GntR family transcriptional regulator n=1 Tax=Leucobacter allii TaxID=2932247 RepID=UPI001FD5BEF2|nr:GntR family transcriptional regulator [Leucobacter allii]UOR01492.1 GntR family transcriptional regulator [Leucobacter allii]
MQESSATTRAYEHIRDGIIEGRYATDEMLGESGLAAELSMSRTPVRAALVRLQEEQWITIYPKRGALVRGLGDRAIADLSEARYILETAAVQRADPGQMETLAGTLTRVIAEQQAALETQDVHRFVDLTTAFHRSFVEVCGNQVLLELSDRLADRQRYMLFRLGGRLLEQCQLILAEHRELVEALQAGDPSRFADGLRKHITDVHTERAAPVPPIDAAGADRA